MSSEHLTREQFIRMTAVAEASRCLGPNDGRTMSTWAVDKVLEAAERIAQYIAEGAPQPRSAADHAAAAQRVLSYIAKCTEAPEQMIPAQEGHPVPQEPLA